MNHLNFTVDADKCTHCGTCIEDCVRQIITWSNHLPTVSPEREEECIGCQHCLAVCPTAAVSIFGLNPADCLPVDRHAWPSGEQMNTLFRTRRTVRQYSSTPVSADCIDAMLETIQYAPTGRNDLGLTFTLIDNRKDMVKLLEKIGELTDAAQASGTPIPEFLTDAVAAYRNDGRDHIFRGAPHVLMATADPESGCPHEDIIIALTNFYLLAECRGLGTTWCGYLKIIADTLPGLREFMGFQPSEYFYTMLFGRPAVGYPRGVQRDHAQKIRRIAF
jgi:nitroreductase/NAD-dependent dihydropyrimidine dehydrogenase PreA subunit